MKRTLAVAACSCSLTLGACDYERLPTKFHLIEVSAQPGLTVMYTESMRDPANANFPPVTVRLIGVAEESMHDGKFDMSGAIDAAMASGGTRIRDIALNQGTRLVTIPPDDPLFASPYVLGAAFLAWAGPEAPPVNYIEKPAVFDDKGNQISEYVAAPFEDQPPPPSPPPDRRAVLISTEKVRTKGLVLEVDREGVKVLPSSLRLGEARAIPAEDSK